MENINFFELLNISEFATDEQIDSSVQEYISKNHIGNPDDASSLYQVTGLNRIKEILKQPDIRALHMAQIRADRYSDDTDFRLVCGMRDTMIDVLNKRIEQMVLKEKSMEHNSQLKDMIINQLESTISVQNENISNLNTIIELLQKEAKCLRESK